jgi:hypothetical protein
MTKGEAMDTKDQKNKFTADALRKLQDALDEVAPYQATEVSKQQAIRLLSPQILSLRSKGYSWTAVAAMLSEHGVAVSVAALRTHLRRARVETESEVPRTTAKRLRGGRAVARWPEPSPPIGPSQPPSRETLAASKPQQAGARPASVVPAPHSTASVAGHEQEPRRSTLAVRPDRRDI